MPFYVDFARDLHFSGEIDAFLCRFRPKALKKEAELHSPASQMKKLYYLLYIFVSIEPKEFEIYSLQSSSQTL